MTQILTSSLKENGKKVSFALVSSGEREGERERERERERDRVITI